MRLFGLFSMLFHGLVIRCTILLYMQCFADCAALYSTSSVCIHIHEYIYICVHVYIHMYTYTYSAWLHMRCCVHIFISEIVYFSVIGNITFYRSISNCFASLYAYVHICSPDIHTYMMFRRLHCCVLAFISGLIGLMFGSLHKTSDNEPLLRG